MRRTSPRTKRAAPTPPARRTTFRRTLGVRDGLAPGLATTRERRALDRDAARRAHERLDLLDRRVLAGVGAGLARDALLHERAAEVVAAGAERQLREAVSELHPRRLEVIDQPSQHEAADGVDT